MPYQILGDYKILKQIGQGSMGLSLHAEHRFIKKQYILKVLPQEFCQEATFLPRFEEEIAKLSQMDHPHIVKVYNVSFHEGVYFLVTDCILDSAGEMTNLGQYMETKKERLKEEEILSIASQLASALDYAHMKAQVAHLCLKLNNILIGKNRSHLEVSISDFGLSKVLGPGKILKRTYKEVSEALDNLPLESSEERYFAVSIGGSSRLNHSFLQNFAFLAPEQKKSENMGTQADIYAFGVVIYYLITGQFPEGRFTLPSRFLPSSQWDWDELVSECLEQDPSSRPTQLLPLLEKFKKKESFVRKTREIESEKEEHNFEHLKVKLHEALPQETLPLREAMAMAELKPLLRRMGEEEIAPQKVEIKTIAVETKAVTEATASPITPQKNEASISSLSAMMHHEPVVTQYQPEKKEVSLVEPIPTEMVVIRGGEFMRGSNEGHRDEAPYHRVKIDSFAMDIHPVTNEQFVRFLEYMGGEKDPNYNDLIRLKDSRINRVAGKVSIEPGYARHPVVGVTWYGAVAYARWVGKKLPTEAEWEVAARGGLENVLFPTGDNIEKNQSNFFSSDTTPVMSYVPNGYGLFDMVGNVYEWCHDWYGYNYYETSMQEPRNPKGPQQGVYRVLRGGCWKSLKEDLRIAHRHRNNPGTVNSTYGFRCVADVQ